MISLVLCVFGGETNSIFIFHVDCQKHQRVQVLRESHLDFKRIVNRNDKIDHMSLQLCIIIEQAASQV